MTGFHRDFVSQKGMVIIMSIGINSYNNTVNSYTASQKSDNERATLAQMQERLQNSNLNTDLLEITPLSNEQMQNYISENNNLSSKYNQYFGGTRNMDDVLSFYEQGRADIFKTYGSDGAFLNAHLSALDSAFESQMKNIGDAVAGDLASERYTREQEAIYIPKYINQLEQWYKDALKNGDKKSIGILSVEIDRMNARLGNADTNKLAMHSDFDEVELKTNMANQLWEYARLITQNFKSVMDAISAQKTAFELMLQTFNKTTSINNLSFSDVMVVYKHSDGNTAKGAIGSQGEFLIAEYPSHTGVTHAAVFNQNSGLLIAGKFTSPDDSPENYTLKEDKDSGSALFFALMPAAMEDDEFGEVYGKFLEHYRKYFPMTTQSLSPK